jgi:hypothetical protein
MYCVQRRYYRISYEESLFRLSLFLYKPKYPIPLPFIKKRDGMDMASAKPYTYPISRFLLTLPVGTVLDTAGSFMRQCLQRVEPDYMEYKRRYVGWLKLYT